MKKYQVTIWTNCKKVEWETDDISPSSIQDVVNLEQFDGDFITKGEIKELKTGRILDLSEDGNWTFVERKS